MEQNEQQPQEEPLAIERLELDELLELRRQLRKEPSDLLDKLDDELETLAKRDSDLTATILEALSRGEESDRTTAANYIGALLGANKERAVPLLAKLLQDTSESVRTMAFDTLEAEVGRGSVSLAEAMPLAQMYFTSKGRDEQKG